MKMLNKLVALLILGQICADLPEVGGAIVKRTDGVLGMEKLHYDRPGQCPTGATWCRHTNGESSCCPLTNAVCCANAPKCCPEGTTCSASGKCETLSVIPWSEKTVICPGGQSKCPDRNTCCSSSSGQWGCCPLPNAVCCSDGENCCPQGYTCDVEARTCSKMIENEVMSSEMTSLAKNSSSLNFEICPDLSVCPDGTICCMLSSGEWECCSWLNAVCCSDEIHCCPQGYTCDVAAGTCYIVSEDKVARVKWLNVGQSSSKVKSVVCPDGQSECPDDNTCCMSSSEEWGCCPLPNAVCCSDQLHCCPNGYTCSSGSCIRSSPAKALLSAIMPSKIVNKEQGTNTEM